MNKKAGSNRSIGVGLIVSGVACVVGGLVMSLLITTIFGRNTQAIATGVVGTGVGMVIAGILNVLTGKNLAEMKLLPDVSKAGPLLQVVIVLIRMLLSFAIFIVLFALAIWFFG